MYILFEVNCSVDAISTKIPRLPKVILHRSRKKSKVSKEATKQSEYAK
jgi:hypothetical protein